jgi:hypothetical protein
VDASALVNPTLTLVLPPTPTATKAWQVPPVPDPSNSPTTASLPPLNCFNAVFANLIIIKIFYAARLPLQRLGYKGFAIS